MFNCSLVFRHIVYLVCKGVCFFFPLLLRDAWLPISDCKRSALFCVLRLYLRIKRASLYVFQTGVQCRDTELASSGTERDQKMEDCIRLINPLLGLDRRKKSHRCCFSSTDILKYYSHGDQREILTEENKTMKRR